MKLPALSPGHLLEIGCAPLSFLHHMASQGLQLQGVKFSAIAARVASFLGIDVYNGLAETAPSLDHAPDLIVGLMVLEHLYDSVGRLQNLRECSKPTGKLAICAPNAGSIEFCIFNEKWHLL
jgi:hypothetical protein